MSNAIRFSLVALVTTFLFAAGNIPTGASAAARTAPKAKAPAVGARTAVLNVEGMT